MAEGVGSVLGSAVGEAAAFAAGLAIGPVLAPLLRALENETWSQYPDMPVPAQSLAQGVAEHKYTTAQVGGEAALTGFGPTAFATLVELVKRGPGIAQGLRMIQRGQLAPADFVTVLQRAGLEDEWVTAYQRLSVTGLEPWQEPLSPADIALGLIRNNLAPQDVNGQPMFPPGGDSSGSVVPHDPVSGIDVLAEAEASGLDPERMAVLARNVGLPPGVIEGLRMLNRGIIDEPSFYLLIEQSDARLSWGPFLIQLRREILTPHEYVEARLRAWIDTDEEMYAGTAMSGLNQADTDLLFRITGRPIAPHRVFIGERRGGTYDGPTDGIDAAFLKAQQESNERPEWYNLDWAARFTKPTLFFVRTWLKDGHDPAQAHTWLYELGYEESDIALIIQAYTPAGGAPGGKKLTVAEVKAAWKAATITPAEALTRLEALGYSTADATILMQTWAFVPPVLQPIP